MLIRRSGLDTPPRNFFREPDKRAAEKALRDAGISRREAKTVLALGWDQTFGSEPEAALRDAEPVDGQHPRDAVAELLSKLKEKS